MEAKLSFNYPFYNFQDVNVPSLFREFLDWGIDRFVFVDPWAVRCVEEPSFVDTLRNWSKEFGIRFVSMHAPYGDQYDLNVPNPALHEKKVATHKRAMEIAAEFGSKTYTIHVGAYHHCCERVPLEVLRPEAKRTLEELIPSAEKLGIVIAVENSFEPPNSAQEVVDCITPFLSSPAIGVCYDTGHANIMQSAPWKSPDKYEPYMYHHWWQTGIVEDPDPLGKLIPYIVTTHIHDNSGYGDLHSMPFDGTIDWKTIMPRLMSCPRMMEYQTEVCYQYGTNWAGKLPAPVGGYSIKSVVETFDKLFKLGR